MMKNHFSLPLLILVALSQPLAFAQGITNIPGDESLNLIENSADGSGEAPTETISSDASVTANSTKSISKREVRVEVRKNWEGNKKAYQQVMTDFYGLAYEAQYKSDQYYKKWQEVKIQGDKAKRDAAQAEAESKRAMEALERGQKELEALKKNPPASKLGNEYQKTNAFLEQEWRKKIASLTQNVANLDSAAKASQATATDLRTKSNNLSGNPDEQAEVKTAKEEMTAAKTAYEAGKETVKNAETALSKQAEDANFAGGIKETRGSWLFGGRNKTKKLSKETDQKNLKSTTGSLEKDAQDAAEANFLAKNGLTVAPDIRKLEPKPAPKPVVPSVQVVIPTADEIKSLDADGIKKLTPDQIKGITPAVIGALTAAQIGALGKEQIEALTAPQIQALTLEQIGQFCEEQVPSFTKDQIAGMTSEQVVRLNEIKPLSDEQKTGLNDDQKKALAKAAEEKKKTEDENQKKTCDAAAAKLAELMMTEKGQHAFSDLIKLAQLKMAYRLSSDKPPSSTIEEYLNKSGLAAIRANKDFPGKLKSVYESYGITDDLKKLKNSGLFDSKTAALNYTGKYPVPLDNQSASAAVLYLSMQDSSKDQKGALNFSEADAAAVWALGKFSETQKEHSASRNLLSFNTRVCQMFEQRADGGSCGNGDPTKKDKRFKLGDTASIQKSFDDQNKSFNDQVAQSVEKLKDEAKLCFTEQCADKSVVLKSDAVEAAKKALTQAVMKGSVGAKTIDFQNTRSVNGTITIQMK